jgi:hypothetical protein
MRSLQAPPPHATRAGATALALRLLCAAPWFAGAAVAADAAAARSGPLGGGGTLELEPVVAPDPPARTRRLVFACVGDGVPVTFSDRPCGPAAATRELRLAPAGTAAGAAPDVVPPRRRAEPRAPATTSSSAARASAGDATDPDRGVRRSQCQRLEEAVAALDQHMRAGYSARESGRLWARWREAKERLRKSGC